MISLYVTEIRFTTDIWKIATSHQIGISRRRESREGVERQKRLASHGSQLSKFDFVTILFGIVFLDARSADCDFNAREAIRFQRDLFAYCKDDEQTKHTPLELVILANLFTKPRSFEHTGKNYAVDLTSLPIILLLL